MRTPEPPPERWFFESLSPDGRRALLRRIDGRALSPVQARIVDVDTGALVESAPLEELGRLEGAGDIVELDAMLSDKALRADIVHGAEAIRGYPFGSCGRFSAAPQGGAIAFNAGDWIYLTDGAGRVRQRVAQEAAYDPRFTPDGRHLLFRRASGKVDDVFARYELFVVPADLSSKPRAIRGTAFARDRFAFDPSARAAVAIASHEPQVHTCAISVSLRPPFTAKTLACLTGGEPLVDSVLSPSGRFAAITTRKAGKWHVRVLALRTGRIVLDEPGETGLVVRAISDDGLLVRSGARGVVVDALGAGAHRRRDYAVDIDHRGFFRKSSELVYVTGASVAVLDLSDV